MAPHLLEAARVAYRIDGSDQAWLAAMLAAMQRGGGGLAGWMATYDARGTSPIVLGVMVGSELARGWRAAVRLGVRLVPNRYARRAFDIGVCGTLSQLLGDRLAQTPGTGQLLTAFGARDVIGVNARDPTGLGVVAGLNLPQVTQLSHHEVERWANLAAHIAAGHRLRRALASDQRSLLDGAEAVLERDGRLAHARDAATTTSACEVLRKAARTLEQVGVPKPSAPEEALHGWPALVDGRWTLVDHFDSDGRRYFVARKNDPAAPGPRELTGRQRQIVGYAALGHSNKLIAYELGLSEAAISHHLARAAERLGLRTRTELVRAVLTLRGQATSGDEPPEDDAGPH